MGFLVRPAAEAANRISTPASAASNSIELTKRHQVVSLTKQGAATGNLRVNLSWRMRTSDIGGRSQQRAACSATP